MRYNAYEIRWKTAASLPFLPLFVLILNFRAKFQRGYIYFAPICTSDTISE